MDEVSLDGIILKNSRNTQSAKQIFLYNHDCEKNYKKNRSNMINET